MVDNSNLYQAYLAGDIYGPNPYAPYQNTALPWPSQYAGTPTNAMGQPIQQAPGTTLNTPPAAAQPPAANPQQWALNNQMINAMARGYQGNPGNQSGPSYTNVGGSGANIGDIISMRLANNQAYGVQGNPQARNGMPAGAANMTLGQIADAMGGTPSAIRANQIAAQMGQPAPAATPGGGGAGAGGQSTMGLPNALQLLSNPGNPVTPGATVPQSQPAGMHPSVLGSFLGQNQGGVGAGNYNNQPFFATLNALRNQ